MKNNLKKILTAALISTASLSIIGCATPNTKLAKNIDKGMAEFVSSINNLDYVDPTSSTDSSIGKIVETAAPTNTISDEYLTKTLEELDIENSISIPSSREDNFKLYVLSESPFISFTSDDNGALFNLQLNFSTNKISETSYDINSKINDLILKRSILMIYVNEIYNNRVNLTDENRIAINAYVNVIRENASYLDGNRGMVKNQLTLANDLLTNSSNNNLVNYYIIKSGEALETRSSKIDSSISAIDSIIDIIESNLTSSSVYYNTNLSTTYEDIITNIKNNSMTTASAENKELADNISNSLNFGCVDCYEQNNSASEPSTNTKSRTINNSTSNINSKNTTNTQQINNATTKSQQTQNNPAKTQRQTNNNISNTTINNKNNKSNQSKLTNQTHSTNQHSIQNQNRSTSQNISSRQNHSDLNNNQPSSQVSEVNTERNINRKNANINNFNRNSIQKLRNNEQNADNNLDNNTNQNDARTLEMRRNSRQHNRVSNTHNQISGTNIQVNEIDKNVSDDQNSKINERRNLNSHKNYESNENIKRVPYIRNFD